MTPEEQIAAIKRYVKAHREENNITPTPGKKWEGSCFMHGEGINLLYVQLVRTTEGTGDWKTLGREEVRKLVLDEIAKDTKYKP